MVLSVNKEMYKIYNDVSDVWLKNKLRKLGILFFGIIYSRTRLCTVMRWCEYLL